MTQPIYCDPTRRHDFVLLFDVVDGNPNGDPDAGNLPRVDPETMQGLVTDVAIKRKVRDFVDMTHGTEERNKIYVQSNDALNTVNQRAYTALGLQSTGTKQNSREVEAARDWMCANFYDIRMFGAVMTTKVNCGQVRGPIQLTFARSIDPVTPLDVAITRIAVTREEDREVKLDDQGEGRGSKQTEMGRKAMVPYGLYRAHGFFNPHFAAASGATADDLALFWQALERMWDYDRSAARGMMSCRGIYIFSHSSSLGNAPAHALFEGLQIERIDSGSAPRQFRDYRIRYTGNLPHGVELSVL
jgi:CRISPR-associated protein Csd2